MFREVASDVLGVMRESVATMVREQVQASISTAPPAQVTDQASPADGDTASDDDASQSEACETSDLIANAIRGLTAGEGTAHTDSTPGFVSNTSNLGASVLPKTKERICNDEYIELEILIPGRDKDFSINLESRPGQTSKVSVSQNKNKGFRSVDEWEDAFLIYATIYMATHPQEGGAY
jgi:hypothetical protein